MSQSSQQRNRVVIFGRSYAWNDSRRFAPVSNLAKIDPAWDKKKLCCNAIIETPKGRRNKFDYNQKHCLFELGGLLPEGLSFPFDFGFIPRTRGQDGDPLDVLVLMEEPAHVGCLLQVRILGVLSAQQSEGKKRISNNRLIAAAIHSYAHEKLSNIDQVNESILDQVDEFFISYNKSRRKTYIPKGRHGPKHAAALIEAGMAAFKKK